MGRLQAAIDRGEAVTTETASGTALDHLRERALAELAGVADVAGAEGWERAFLGAKGELTRFLRGLA
ncbi:MAG: hypothetical protein M3Q10_06970, partial [Chloroflexota bacterium]|nr:hypothetical protein [Chloroflexota bacterium]